MQAPCNAPWSRRAETTVLAACQMAVLSARWQLTPAEAGGHSQGNFRFPMCTTLPAGLSQYAAHASISLRRFSSASLRR
jgi:hypothetical protein